MHLTLQNTLICVFCNKKQIKNKSVPKTKQNVLGIVSASTGTRSVLTQNQRWIALYFLKIHFSLSIDFLNKSWLILGAAAAKSLQSCPTLCDPIDDSPPGSPVPGILQARTLEWVAISFSNAWKWKVKVKSLSRVLLCATPWTTAYQAPPSLGFSRQVYWSGVPLVEAL